MVNAEIIINKPLDMVWNFYTNPKNWGKWWLQGIKKIIPGWEEDAVVHWSDDSECSVWSITPKKIVQLNSQWMRTTFKFSAINEGTTLQVKLDARWGEGFEYRGVAERAELAGALKKLKENIESL
jgi:uncharacterized protein YndB with AHSA1/START domain